MFAIDFYMTLFPEYYDSFQCFSLLSIATFFLELLIFYLKTTTSQIFKISCISSSYNTRNLWHFAIVVISVYRVVLTTVTVTGKSSWLSNIRRKST